MPIIEAYKPRPSSSTRGRCAGLAGLEQRTASKGKDHDGVRRREEGRRGHGQSDRVSGRRYRLRGGRSASGSSCPDRGLAARSFSWPCPGHRPGFSCALCAGAAVRGGRDAGARAGAVKRVVAGACCAVACGGACGAVECGHACGDAAGAAACSRCGRWRPTAGTDGRCSIHAHAAAVGTERPVWRRAWHVRSCGGDASEAVPAVRTRDAGSERR